MKANHSSFVEPAIVLDAALRRMRDRSGAVALARRFSCRLVGIRISCTLDEALQRNRARVPDEVVPDEVIRIVLKDFESLSLEEGFDEVFEVENENRINNSGGIW